ITGAGGKDYYAAFFEMANGATANEWFSELRNVDGGHYSRLHLQVLQRVLQHDGIHHGREHADVISRGAIHIAGAGRDAAENVSTADHQRGQPTWMVDATGSIDPKTLRIAMTTTRSLPLPY